jgi:hypothetical protein
MPPKPYPWRPDICSGDVSSKTDFRFVKLGLAAHKKGLMCIKEKP